MPVQHKGTSPWFCGTLFFTLILLINIFGAAQAQDNVRPDVIEVTAAVPREFPPYYGVDEHGKPEGFAIEVMDQIAQLSGLRVRYLVEDSWTDVENAVKSGRAVLIPNVGFSEARKMWLDYTAPVETFPISIFVREYTTEITGVDDLIGRKVAAVRFDIGVDLLKERQGIIVKVFNDPQEALLELLAGRVDAVAYTGPVFLKLAREAGLEHRIRVAGEPLKEIIRAMAVAKGNVELLTRINQAVNRFVGTKDYEVVFKRWFGEPPPFWSTTRVVSIVVGCGLVLCFLMAGWRYYSLIHLNRKLSTTIAERKRAEEALRESEATLRALINAPTDSILVLDARGLILDLNEIAAERLGMSRDELIGTCAGNSIPVDTARRRQSILSQVFETGRAVRFEDERGAMWFDQVAYPILDKDGAVVKIAVIARDITERKRAEEEKERLQVQLLQAQKAESLGRMAGAIAHNYNNLMGVVMGHLDLALTELPDGWKLQRSLVGAMKASRRAADISHLMLAYLGKSEGKREALDLSEICRESLPFLIATVPEKLRFKTEFPPSGPIIQGNAGQINQVLSNLVTNAVEATGDGEGDITVAIEVVPAASIPELPISPAEWRPKDESYACLSITDTGCGMDRETVDKVFDPFFSTKFTGRGLGLPVVAGIAKAHEGAVTVESVVGQGTVFRVFLPLAPRALA